MLHRFLMGEYVTDLLSSIVVYLRINRMDERSFWSCAKNFERNEAKKNMLIVRI